MSVLQGGALGENHDQKAPAVDQSPHPCSSSKYENPAIPTLIIDKSAQFRAGLRCALNGHRFRVIADTSSLDAILASVLNHQPCLVLLGSENVACEALVQNIASLKREAPGTFVIVLGGNAGPDEWIMTINAGANGWLVKSEITLEALIQAIEVVLLGEVVVSRRRDRKEKNIEAAPYIPSGIPADQEHTKADSSTSPAIILRENKFGRLTDRENAILQKLKFGASNKHIARELNIAEATVKVHIKHLLRKVQVDNRTQLALWALRNLPNN